LTLMMGLAAAWLVGSQALRSAAAGTLGVGSGSSVMTTQSAAAAGAAGGAAAASSSAGRDAVWECREGVLGGMCEA